MLKTIRPDGLRWFFGGKAVALAAVLMISACSPPPPKAGSPEALLNAEGEWKLVEEERLPSPEQKHKSTRAQVNPKKSSAGYTENVKLAQVDEDVHFRVLRLERQMNTLRSDFNKILPPLAEEARAAKSMEAALAEIQTAAGDVDASDQVLAEAAAAPTPTSVAAPVPMPAPSSDSPSSKGRAPAPPMVITPEKPQSANVPAKSARAVEKSVVPAGAAQVTALRVGEHPGKTRLVLDVSAASKFSADMDANENILVVELPSVSWSAPMHKAFDSHSILKSYTAQSSAEGTRLVIEMKGPAKLAMKSALAPNDVYGHRIVLDVAPF